MHPAYNFASITRFTMSIFHHLYRKSWLWWFIAYVELSTYMQFSFTILPWFSDGGGCCSWTWFWSAVLSVSTTLGVYWYRLPLANRQVMTTHSTRMTPTRSVIVHPRLINTQQSIPLCSPPQLVSSAKIIYVSALSLPCKWVCDN